MKYPAKTDIAVLLPRRVAAQRLLKPTPS